MNEEQLNADLRRFLKTFGVGAQREIEAAIRKALESGALSAGQPVPVRARLEILGVEFLVEDELRLQ
jgi:hypothetical protein